MMGRDERRRLDEIGQHLSEDDPDFARKLTKPRPLWNLLHRWPVRMWLAAALFLLASVCLVTGDMVSMLVAAAAGTAIVMLRNWSFDAR
ncbi:hypothetical protein GCM10027271_30990 [Saccharopolyspora gloriosae]|uniref:Mg2+/citrate symporter n=1 Tax=Saccharopolyspora gloriosae TaxID=455344 RepID=A0A840NDJ7_9PSEU|nr:DUF3040 domain-containing protein [Saccharopolyspora gloriosae]MBB5070000.1 Mg2+/citrate symporter [Saccharopolyspora gloriosae]